jgi:hypothetical protein
VGKINKINIKEASHLLNCTILIDRSLFIFLNQVKIKFNEKNIFEQVKKRLKELLNLKGKGREYDVIVRRLD